MPLKIILILAIFFCSFVCHAQVRPTLFAGPQATSAYYTVRGAKQTTDFKFGFMAGGGLKVPFENQLYFFPSVYYSLKGYKVALKDTAAPPTQFAKNNNTTIQTIEVAPLFQVDLSKRPSHFFFRIGPSVDFAFSGKEKFDTSLAGGSTISRNMVFSFGDYGRITASANLHLGYETAKGFMVFAQYVYGLGSMNNADYGPHIFHRVIGLSVGWSFGHNPNLIDTHNRE
jgi:hypothetical protein